MNPLVKEKYILSAPHMACLRDVNVKQITKYLCRKMNYNYILYTLILCILGYMF